jgi:hypothetical protein
MPGSGKPLIRRAIFPRGGRRTGDPMQVEPWHHEIVIQSL